MVRYSNGNYTTYAVLMESVHYQMNFGPFEYWTTSLRYSDESGIRVSGFQMFTVHACVCQLENFQLGMRTYCRKDFCTNGNPPLLVYSFPWNWSTKRNKMSICQLKFITQIFNCHVNLTKLGYYFCTKNWKINLFKISKLFLY